MSSPLKQNTTTIQNLINIINSLPEASSGVELPTLTNEGSASDLLSGKQLIDQEGNVVTGTIATKTASNLTASGATVTVPAGYYASQATKSVSTATQATPSISVDANGKITASATQTAGYVAAGTKSGTKQLTTKAAATITPTKSSQTAVAKDVYTTGAITVAAIPSQYITTTDATASADEIMNGETAYVNGSKVTGTFSIDDELTTQDNLISQIQTALQNKIDGLPSLQEKTITPSTISQTITPDSSYDGLSKVTVNAMPHTTQATPSISIDFSNGLITASTTQTEGYVTDGIKTSSYQLAFQDAKTVTPTTFSQTAVPSKTYTTGTVTVAGDSNLVARNIKNGVSIFGVNGTYDGTSDEDINTVASLIAKTITECANDKVEYIGSYAFNRCSSLTTASFPKCTTINNTAFNRCTSLTTVSFPKCTSIGDYAFSGCTSLTTVSFPECTSIGDAAFSGCTKLSSIYLTNSSICTLSNSNAFSMTGIWSNKGSIFVPSSLVASYKAATNWVFFSNRIYSA